MNEATSSEPPDGCFARFVKVFVSKQFLKFLIVGGVAAALHWLARYFLNFLIGYVSALVIAYAIGIAVGYALNATIVFSRAVNRRREQVSYFIAFNIAMAPAVIAISFILSEYVFLWAGFSFHPREFAHAIAVVSPVFVNFLLHKYLTFKGA